MKFYFSPQYLHEKHILHRDLKTQNVFLTRTNIIKVGDLGIARVLENQCDMASTLIGTPYYMSPELFSNKPYNYKVGLGVCQFTLSLGQYSSLQNPSDRRIICELAQGKCFGFGFLRGKIQVKHSDI